MRHTQLVNYTLYQIGWFACVLGGASHRPWTGFLVAMILVGLLPPLDYGLFRLSICWAIALMVFSAVVRRVTGPRQGYR